MTMTARQRSRKLREEFERRGREREMAVPIRVRVAYKICEEMNGGYGRCACARTPSKSVCDRMDGMARSIIDEVRRSIP